MKQSLIFLSKNLPPVVCGVGDYVNNVALELAALGHSPELVAFGDFPKAICEQAKSRAPDGVKVTFSSVFQLALGVMLGRRSLRHALVCVQYTTQNYRFDLYLVILAILCRLQPKATFHIVFHECLYQSPDGAPLRRRVGYAVLGAKERLLAKLANKVFVTTDEKYQILQKVIPKPGHLQLIGIPSNIGFQPSTATEISERRAELASRTGGSDTSILIGLFTRSLDENRNHFAFLRAFCEAHEREPNLRLVVIGPVMEEPESFRRAMDLVRESLAGNEAITWLGHLPSDQVSITLQALDWMAFPLASWRMFTSTTLAASLLHGLPLLLGDSDNVPSDMREFVGVMERFTGPDLLRALDSLTPSESMRSRIMQYYARNFSWHEVAMRLIDADPGMNTSDEANS